METYSRRISVVLAALVTLALLSACVNVGWALTDLYFRVGVLRAVLHGAAGALDLVNASLGVMVAGQNLAARRRGGLAMTGIAFVQSAWHLGWALSDSVSHLGGIRIALHGGLMMLMIVVGVGALGVAADAETRLRAL